MTITHDAFDFTVQGPPALAPPLPSGDETSGGDHWRPVQTRSFGILPLGMTSGGVH